MLLFKLVSEQALELDTTNQCQPAVTMFCFRLWYREECSTLDCTSRWKNVFTLSLILFQAAGAPADDPLGHGYLMLSFLQTTYMLQAAWMSLFQTSVASRVASLFHIYSFSVFFKIVCHCWLQHFDQSLERSFYPRGWGDNWEEIILRNFLNI